MKKKNITRLLLVLVSLIFLVSCGKAKLPIKIAYVGGLTGKGADLGVSGMYGAQLAVDEINAAGGIMGRPLQLEIRNDESDPAVALQVDQALVAEGIPIIIGHMISGVATSVIPFINSGDYLMVSPTMALGTLSNQMDNFIRLIPSNITQAELLSQTIIDQKVKQLGILVSSSNIAFAQSIIDYIEGATDQSATKIVSQVVYPTEQPVDYQQISELLMSQHLDGLLIIGSSDEVSYFAQVFDLLNYHPKVFLPAWSMTSDLIIKGGRPVEGFFGVNYIDLDSKQPDYLNFYRSFKQKYGQDPSFASILAYEAVQVVGQAMESGKSAAPLDVKKIIQENNDYRGLFGDLLINPYGDASRDISLYQIKQGRFIEYQP